MCFKDTDDLPEKLIRKLLKLDMGGEGWTDRGNTIPPFHISSTGGDIKISILFWLKMEYKGTLSRAMSFSLDYSFAYINL